MPRRRHIIAPVFLPMAGCPHRCIYCNQAVLHPGASGLPTMQEIDEVAERYFGDVSCTGDPAGGPEPHLRCRPYNVIRQLAFYGGNFCGLNAADKERLLDHANTLVKARALDGVRVSTRPDEIDAAEAAFLAAHGVTFVELGAQSLDDDVIARAKRGHTAEDVAVAVRPLKDAGIGVSLHLMAGLPGAAFESDVESARRVATLMPDAVRIHPTLVLTGSALEDEWHAGTYIPLTLDEAVARCAVMMEIFDRAAIPVIRVGLHGDDELVSGRALCAGPFHPNFRDLVTRKRAAGSTA